MGEGGRKGAGMVGMRKLSESADSEVGSGSIGFFPNERERVRFVAHDKREPELERREERRGPQERTEPV